MVPLPRCPRLATLSAGCHKMCTASSVHHTSVINSFAPGNYGSHLNSLAPGEFEWNFRYVIFKQILVINGWGISCEIALIWMSLDFTDDQSTLVQVMAWCCQATIHYLSQCWPRSLPPYGVTRPQWVNLIFTLIIQNISLGTGCEIDLTLQ